MTIHAFPLQLAKEAVLLGKYTHAANLLESLSASKDNADAQFLHAYLHFWDDNLSRSTAIGQMTRLAKQQHPEASYVMAACPDLLPGYTFHLPRTEEQFRDLQRAANLGSIAARTDVAECYLTGRVVVVDKHKAQSILEDTYDRNSHNYPKMCVLLSQVRESDGDWEEDFSEIINPLRTVMRQQGDRYAIEAARWILQYLHRYVAKYPEHFIKNEIPEHEKIAEKTSASLMTHWQSYLHYWCRTTLVYDLRQADFDAYCDFIFDHEPTFWPKTDAMQWERTARVLFDANQLLEFYIELFNQPAFLLDRYTEQQIKRGLGSFTGLRTLANWSLACVMRRADIKVDQVVRCYRAMPTLFENIFSRSTFSDIGYTWWDAGFGMCGSDHYSYQNRAEKRNPTVEEQERLTDAYFETKVQVLRIDNLYCQEAALYGLGHSTHTEKKWVIQAYLDEHPNLSESLHNYALAAIDGDIF